MLCDTFCWCQEQIRTALTTSDILDRTCAFLAPYGIAHVAYLHSCHLDAERAVTYSQRWCSKYADEGYVAIDPVVRHATQNLVPCLWSDMSFTKDDADFMARSQQFGVPINGISTCLRDNGPGFAMFSVAGDFTSPRTLKARAELTLTIDIIAKQFHIQLQTLLQIRAEAQRLSPREREVIHWAAEGKTSWETAHILGLTEGTVGQYLHAAVKKLNAVNKANAVAEAVRRGIV